MLYLLNCSDITSRDIVNALTAHGVSLTNEALTDMEEAIERAGDSIAIADSVGGQYVQYLHCQELVFVKEGCGDYMIVFSHPDGRMGGRIFVEGEDPVVVGNLAKTRPDGKSVNFRLAVFMLKSICEFKVFYTDKHGERRGVEVKREISECRA